MKSINLTVESYTVIYAANNQTYYYLFSITHTLSFIPELKPSFSANPSHCSLSFSSSGLTTLVIPKLWPAGHFWPAASYKMARQDLWSRIFYLHHRPISV